MDKIDLSVLVCPFCKNNMEIEDLVLGVWVKCKPCKLVIGGDRGFKTIYHLYKHLRKIEINK